VQAQFVLGVVFKLRVKTSFLTQLPGKMYHILMDALTYIETQTHAFEWVAARALLQV